MNLLDAIVYFNIIVEGNGILVGHLDLWIDFP